MEKTISIVLCGRNDNCNGDFEKRCLAAMTHNLAHLSAIYPQVQWVYVEWNPIDKKPLFTEKLRVLLPELISVVVSREVHEERVTHANIGMLQFHAKNVGLRRAQTDWVLVLNADTWLTGHLAKTLEHLDQRSPRSLYLAYRRDVESSFLEEGLGFSPITEWKITHTNEPDPPLDYGPCGDFMLMHRELIKKTGGYFEGITFSNCHIDMLFCQQVRAMGDSIEYLGDVYHVEHADSYTYFDGSDAAHHHGGSYCWQHVAVPYVNPTNWGLQEALETVEDGCYLLGWNSDLKRELVKQDDLLVYKHYWSFFLEALSLLKRGSVPIILYGFGAEAHRALHDGLLVGANIIGVLDDAGRENAAVSWAFISVDEVPRGAAILIGSAWWSFDLAEKARERGWINEVYPEALRGVEKYQ